MTEDLRETFATARAAKQRAERAASDLLEHLPTLSAAVSCESGQGEKTRQVLMSIWNGEPGHNEVGLCDVLAGLDHELAEAVLAAIAARLFLGGDADAILRPIVEEIQTESESLSM
jgi:hypothetical protein